MHVEVRTTWPVEAVHQKAEQVAPGQGITLTWTNDTTAHFHTVKKGISVDGTVTLSPGKVVVDADLPLLLRPFEGIAEKKVQAQIESFLSGPAPGTGGDAPAPGGDATKTDDKVSPVPSTGGDATKRTKAPAKRTKTSPSPVEAPADAAGSKGGSDEVFGPPAPEPAPAETVPKPDDAPRAPAADSPPEQALGLADGAPLWLKAAAGVAVGVGFLWLLSRFLWGLHDAGARRPKKRG